MDLVDSACGHDPHIGIGIDQGLEPVHHADLGLGIELVKAIDQHQRLAILERLLDETGQAPEIEHGCILTGHIDDDAGGIPGAIEWKLQVGDMIVIGDCLQVRLKPDLKVGSLRGEVSQRDRLS